MALPPRCSCREGGRFRHMTVSAIPGSTAESRSAALTMFEGQVPCVMRFSDPPCPQTAQWIVFFAHEENLTSCDSPEPVPVCDEHKRALQMAAEPFWRTWHQMQPTLCGKCQTPMRVERFEPLGGGRG